MEIGTGSGSNNIVGGRVTKVGSHRFGPPGQLVVRPRAKVIQFSGKFCDIMRTNSMWPLAGSILLNQLCSTSISISAMTVTFAPTRKWRSLFRHLQSGRPNRTIASSSSESSAALGGALTIDPPASLHLTCSHRRRPSANGKSCALERLAQPLGIAR